MSKLAKPPFAAHGIKAVFNKLLRIFTDLSVEARILDSRPSFSNGIALSTKPGELCSNTQRAKRVAAAPMIFKCLKFGFHTASLQERRTFGEPQDIVFTHKKLP